ELGQREPRQWRGDEARELDHPQRRERAALSAGVPDALGARLLGLSCGGHCCSSDRAVGGMRTDGASVCESWRPHVLTAAACTSCWCWGSAGGPARTSARVIAARTAGPAKTRRSEPVG